MKLFSVEGIRCTRYRVPCGRSPCHHGAGGLQLRSGFDLRSWCALTLSVIASFQNGTLGTPIVPSPEKITCSRCHTKHAVKQVHRLMHRSGVAHVRKVHGSVTPSLTPVQVARPVDTKFQESSHHVRDTFVLRLSRCPLQIDSLSNVLYRSHLASNVHLDHFFSRVSLPSPRGGVVTLGGGILNWRRNKIVSHCQAGRVSCLAAIASGTKLLGIQSELMDLGYNCSVTVATDSQSVIDYSRRRGHSVASKHVGLRGLWLQEALENKILQRILLMYAPKRYLEIGFTSCVGWLGCTYAAVKKTWVTVPTNGI